MQLGVKDAARLLNVSEKTIYRWIKQEAIPAYRISDQFRFNRAELLEWATSRRIRISPEIFQEAEATGTPLPRIVDALKAGGIHYRVGGRDRSAVLRSMVEVIRLPDEVDREFLYQALVARETLGSTAIGDGIAIPHVRNPIVLHVQRPTVSLCFLEHPIDFHALDSRPVTTLFTLISPTVRAHLHMLSRLCFMLRHPGFSAAVAEQASREDLLEAARAADEMLQPPKQNPVVCEPEARPASRGVMAR